MSEVLEYRDTATLYSWSDNPRTITAKDLERVMAQIKRFGQYKPLIITDDGEVLGGNARLKVYTEMGVDKVWVSVVDAETEAEKLSYALSDNDVVGRYDEALVKDLLTANPSLRDDFRVSAGQTKTLDVFLLDFEKKQDKAFGDGPEEVTPEKAGEMAGKQAGSDEYIHKLVLSYPDPVFGQVIDGLLAYASTHGLKNNTEAVAHMLEHRAD